MRCLALLNTSDMFSIYVLVQTKGGIRGEIIR